MKRGLVDEGVLQAMTDAQAHRGPDGEGVLVRGNVGIGHRRLSIIDLSGGAQPMVTATQSHAITFNGEIYNYRELREELIGLGVTFHTHSDTETLLHAYVQWGEKCLRRLMGMFAFCIVDYVKKEIFLARDPFGIKPLVYREEPEYFAFASEINALKRIPGPALEVNMRALDVFLALSYIPAPLSAYETIRKLPPGHFLRVGFDGRIGKTTRYWEMTFHRRSVHPKREPLAELDATLRRAVKRHLIADVPVGVFLSGGVDSSLVAAYAAEASNRPLHAFTIGFGGESCDESAYARDVASELGLVWIHREMDTAMYQDLTAVLARYGEPFGDSSALPTLQVSRLAREGHPVVLSGDGGDELFGGYPRYEVWRERWNREWDSFRYYTRYEPGKAISQAWKYVSDETLGRGKRKAAYWRVINSHISQQERQALWRKDAAVSAEGWPASMTANQERWRHQRSIDYPMAMDCHYYMPDDILAKVDIAAMAHGLEVRPPFLDPEVASLAARIPVASILRDALPAGGRGKRILKELAKKRMARFDVDRPKQGFSIPQELGFRPGGALRDQMEGHLSDPSSAFHEWFDLREIRRMLDLQARPDVPDVSHRLWPILAIAAWRASDHALASAP